MSLCGRGQLVLLLAAFTRAGGPPPRCSTRFAAATINNTCVVFPGLAALPVGVWPVHNHVPSLTVFVATPCHNVTAAQTTCDTFVSAAAAPAFQQSEVGHTCYALGNLTQWTTALIDPRNASAGLLLTYEGGTPTGGRARALRFRLTCDPAAPGSAGPVAEAQIGPASNLIYGVTWPTPHACAAVAAPPAACARPPPPPTPPHAATAVPTVQQLAWQDLEVGAMLGFNLQSNCRATSAAGRSAQPCLSFDGATGNIPAALNEGHKNGWIPSPLTVAGWDPAALDTDAWAAAAKSFGAGYVVLVAQHMAGFSLWDTKAHNFSVAHTAYKGGGQDVVKDMVASCKKYGLKLGFFYSVHFNWWLGVAGYEVGHPRIDRALPNLTQAEFLAVAKSQLVELADRFGAEGPVEVWFDGGAGPNTAAISSTVMQVAPGAVCHSCQSNFTKGGMARWMGNENGVMPLPSWGAGSPDKGDNGNPLGQAFIPPSCDAVLREHLWFFANTSTGVEKGVPTSTIGLVRKYLTSVGRAANLILNVGPDGRTGAIPAPDVTRYAEMGTAVACLFGQPLANTSDGLAMSAAGEITWKLGAPIRASNVSIVMREDQRAGQLIGRYTLWCGESLCDMASLEPDNTIPAYHSVPDRTQTGIGHKRILLMTPASTFSAITLRIETHYAVAGQIPALRDIALFDWGGKVRACV